jgi:hypothetical protein
MRHRKTINIAVLLVVWMTGCVSSNPNSVNRTYEPPFRVRGHLWGASRADVERVEGQGHRDDEALHYFNSQFAGQKGFLSFYFTASDQLAAVHFGSEVPSGESGIATAIAFRRRVKKMLVNCYGVPTSQDSDNDPPEVQLQTTKWVVGGTRIFLMEGMMLKRPFVDLSYEDAERKKLVRVLNLSPEELYEEIFGQPE